MLTVEIHIDATIDESWSDWFAGMEIASIGEDESVLRGKVEDQAALYGLISKIRDLKLDLISVDAQEEDTGK